jgi:hypothetical protein
MTALETPLLSLQHTSTAPSALLFGKSNIKEQKKQLLLPCC